MCHRTPRSAKQIKGALTEIIGKAVGDAKLRTGGKADKVADKVQNAIGGPQDTRCRAPVIGSRTGSMDAGDKAAVGSPRLGNAMLVAR